MSQNNRTKGKAIVNILPIEPGSSIAALMPVDVPEEDWENLQIFFATSDGDVRQNALSDFTNVMRNGKIAMKLDQGDRLIGVQVCTEAHDVLLAAANGQAIRFPVGDIRVFYDVAETQVQVLAVVTKAEANTWLKEFGTPT